MGNAFLIKEPDYGILIRFTSNKAIIDVTILDMIKYFR
ncbi:hypothetical protein H375_6800 [Rickettsia prowazekii str. Breinl]|nr:hypothetical protein H374_2030 [Rickettsia prowazekii str. NMRC Madrid E]AGJ02905.1 hypothetical protein H375_6800 [Rickettsia prowazekii str. Breinl]EOB09412.1 MFS type sugar transporter [Rickettsia prowazekii str. Cairo 3]EOB10230.1 hypothetical protein H376_3780 [Rickettsia prowazekii str. GvF12]